MINIKDLETYFGKSFNEIMADGDIVEVKDNIDGAWQDYVQWELELENDVTKIKNDFYEWVQTCNADDLFNYELDTYQRHFRLLDDGKIYYLNNLD